jgi:iron(III) transport system ATP-binding protein
MSALEVGGVHAAYGATPVLEGIDLAVPAGSLTVLVGPSGSGKTTLLRILAGFERPTAGWVKIGTRTVDDATTFVPPQHRRLGWVAQDGALFPHLDVTGNVGFGLPRGRRRSARVAALIEMVGLGAYAHRLPHQLSGGQQQRVALARALAIGPEAVLLDEPFSSLDPGLKSQVRADVLSVLRAEGTTTLLVSHDRDEALSVADRVALLRAGRIVATGTPDVLYGLPPDPDTASFVGDTNLVGGATSGSAQVLTSFGALDLAAPVEPGEVTVLVRPEQLVLAPAGPDAVGHDSGVVAGTVVAIEYHGHDTMVRVRVDPEVGADEIIVRSLGKPACATGERVEVTAHGPVTAWAR